MPAATVTPADIAVAVKVLAHRGRGAVAHAARHIANYRAQLAAGHMPPPSPPPLREDPFERRR